MPQGDCPAIHVDLLMVQAQFLHHSQGLHGKGFIDFDQVQIFDLTTGAVQQLCAPPGSDPGPWSAGGTPAAAEPRMRASGFKPR